MSFNESMLVQFSSLPKLATMSLATLVGATASTSPDQPHWAQVLVWVCTALGGLATLALALIRAFIEVQRYRNRAQSMPVETLDQKPQSPSEPS